MTSAVRASCGLYKMLLLAYPADFRLRFGTEMVTTFSDLISDEWEQNGLPGVARVWWSTLGEVFSAALPLQLQSSIVVATSLSLVSSFALFLAIFYAIAHACDGK
jgi:hypothetical protein